MKNLFFTFLFSLLFTATAAAAGPFLVCEPLQHVESYVLTIDEEDSQEIVGQDMGNNTTRLHYDLGEISDGNHTGTLISKNVWGESDPVPFGFCKIQPECPSGLTIIAQ